MITLCWIGNNMYQHTSATRRRVLLVHDWAAIQENHHSLMAINVFSMQSSRFQSYHRTPSHRIGDHIDERSGSASKSILASLPLAF
jgi:hypothetical protein